MQNIQTNTEKRLIEIKCINCGGTVRCIANGVYECLDCKNIKDFNKPLDEAL